MALLLNMLVFSFPCDRICHLEMIYIGGVPVKNSFSAGPNLNYFYHRGGRMRKVHSDEVGKTDKECRGEEGEKKPQWQGQAQWTDHPKRIDVGSATQAR